MRHGRERMNRQVFIKLYNLGWPYDDIAHVNEQLTGFRPDKSTVGEWARAFELPPRRMRHADLIPWRIRPEHKSDPIHYALQAISRARRGERRGETLSKQNETLSKQDKLRACLASRRAYAAGDSPSCRLRSDEWLVLSPGDRSGRRHHSSSGGGGVSGW